MDFRISINFGSGSLQDGGFNPLRQSQHVDRAVDAGFGRLNRIELVMHRTRRAGQVVDLIHLHKEWMGDVMSQELEVGIF